MSIEDGRYSGDVGVGIAEHPSKACPEQPDMNIVMCGAGEVGRHVADVLAAAGHDITVVDLDGERLRHIADSMDVGTLAGNGASAEVLREAGAEDADLLVAATDSDEINLLCASIAKAIGAKRTIARVHRSAFF